MTGIEEVLARWRELERVQEQLPEDDPKRRAVADGIRQIRDLYRRLTDQSQQTASLLKASPRTIQRGRGDQIRRDAAVVGWLDGGGLSIPVARRATAAELRGVR